MLLVRRPVIRSPMSLMSPSIIDCTSPSNRSGEWRIRFLYTSLFCMCNRVVMEHVLSHWIMLNFGLKCIVFSSAVFKLHSAHTMPWTAQFHTVVCALFKILKPWCETFGIVTWPRHLLSVVSIDVESKFVISPLIFYSYPPAFSLHLAVEYLA